MAESRKYFKGYDFSDFWDDSDYSIKNYVEESPSDELIKSIEKELGGYKLPESYIELMKMHNGGIPKKTIFPTNKPTFWANDHVAVIGIMGIGRTKPYSLCSKVAPFDVGWTEGAGGSNYMKEENDYPDIGICIATCPSIGHFMVMLDYRKCGKGGEPKVVLVEVISGPKIIPLAENFESFIKGLVEKSKFASNFRDENVWKKSGGAPWEAVSIMLGHKDVETVKFCIEHLLERGVGIDPDNKGRSLIADVAGAPGYLEAIKLLVEKGADIEGVGYDGKTAFLTACETMDLEVIKYLHKHGANIHAVHKNKNALMYTRERYTYYHYCPKKINETKIVDYLIKIGIDVNAASKSGVTALMEHARHGFLKTVQALVKCGANINTLTKKGESALFFAIKYKHKEVEKFLFEQGADDSLACILEIRNKNKKDKFDYLSAMYGDSYFPEFLVNKVKALIVKVVEFLDKGVYTTEEVQAKFEAMTIGINKLQKKFEEKDSEIETMARESIAETVEGIITHYKLKIDTETALRERDW